jgi:hypothetical protein
MSEVDLVLLVLKLVSEGESVVIPGESHVLLLVVVLEVGDVAADSVPAKVFLLLGSDREG